MIYGGPVSLPCGGDAGPLSFLERGEAMIDKILDTLFRSELVLSMEDAEELCYMREGKALQKAAAHFSDQLTPEQLPLWKDYLEGQEHYHDYERQLEFERGFCLSGKFILDILLKRVSAV